MPDEYSLILRKHEEAIIRAWVDDIYADNRIDLTTLIPYGQLVDHLPDILDELGHLLDELADEAEIQEATRRMRSLPHVRFRQGAMIDEVARELIILRKVLNQFLWREGLSATSGDIWELRDALRRADTFFDEMIAQVILIYSASFRPPVETRSSIWPPPRRRKTDTPGRKDS
ncbi:MAG TPA: RsbRD N-terminal domain-containing protein [Pyrinomonadaceae bacterium]|nr:RsbRD N-terminal domain-containing protein [Pyrinomonadaceae bacterium]